ncbi:MAG: hypothetical protein AAGH19_04415 [Pseudomonadota bacterium]
MPRRKKIRTTSTDRRTGGAWDSPAVRKLNNIRREVAVEAARIMATEGQRNFMTAKRKAAERVGASTRLVLPSNREVEDALRAYQGFYGGDSHTGNLQSMRETAIEVMRGLDAFRPRLVGPVLDGTADTHTRISLHLFNDPPENILFHLEERGIDYHLEQRRIRGHDGTHREIQLLVTEVNDLTVELALFSLIDLRQAPPSPVDGKPQKRANLPEVEILLAAA